MVFMSNNTSVSSAISNSTGDISNSKGDISNSTCDISINTDNTFLKERYIYCSTVIYKQLNKLN